MKAKIVAKTTPTEGMTLGEFVAHCARVSNPANQNNHETAPRLLRYLVKHGHWSPFEMAALTVSIVTTRDIARQILRHRSMSFQEFSGRYAMMPTAFMPREARLQDTANRQNSLQNEDAELASWWSAAQHETTAKARELYELAIKKGIAKEQARALLPEGLTESRLYMAGTLRSFIHYCQARCGNDTQAEHREIALAIRDLILAEVPELAEVLS